MPILTGRQQIAIKQEGTAGTAETLAAANVILHTGVAEWEPDIVMTPRESLTSSLSGRGSVVGTQAAKIRFKMFLRGTSAAAISTATESDFAVPIKGCGLSVAYSGSTPNEIAIYSPSSTTIVDETTGAYCTVALYEDGKVYKIHGAVGNCVLTFTVGSPVLAEFEFTGLYNAPTDLALLSGITYPSVIEPAFLSAALSLIGTYATAKISSLKLDFGNVIAMRPYPNTAAGFFTAQITARNVTGSLDPEEVLAATNNFFTQWTLGTLGAITTGTFPSGGTNYNMLNLNIPNAAYTKVGMTSRDGMANAPLEFEARANTAAGDNEFELTTT
jgi:hypothetical protein